MQSVDSPYDAPNYQEDWKMLRVTQCIIVGKGTVKGQPTVDIQMTDADGNKYLVMATGRILEMISSGVAGTRARLEARVNSDE
jgi:hypothetical protein